MERKDKCFICDERPAAVGILCHVCHDRIEASKRASKLARKSGEKPIRFITYQEKTVALYDRGYGTGIYRFSDIDTEKLPKSKTIDLNVFCPALNRLEVKRLKRIVLEVNRKHSDSLRLQYVKGDN